MATPSSPAGMSSRGSQGGSAAGTCEGGACPHLQLRPARRWPRPPSSLWLCYTLGTAHAPFCSSAVLPCLGVLYPLTPRALAPTSHFTLPSQPAPTLCWNPESLTLAAQSEAPEHPWNRPRGGLVCPDPWVVWGPRFSGPQLGGSSALVSALRSRGLEGRG